MAKDLKLTAVLVDKVTAGLKQAAKDWQAAVENPMKAMDATRTSEANKAKSHGDAQRKQMEKNFKDRIALVNRSSAAEQKLQDKYERERIARQLNSIKLAEAQQSQASNRALIVGKRHEDAAASLQRKAALAEASLVVDRFDRRIAVERRGHAITLQALKGNDAAIEAEIRRHNAVVSRIQMDKANFPNTPFQQLLGHLNKVTGMMGIQLPQAVNTASSSMTGAGASSAGLAVGLAAAGAAALAMGAGLKFAYGEARESIDADKKLDLVLRSTGRGAMFTSAELSKLANQYQATTDYTDEAVKAAQVILLRYDAIGSDVFPKALKAAADLGAETGDLAGAAFNLGSALQMPEEAGRKLTAMGIKLTDTEKKMLEQFAETGETIKAQEFILAKVAKAYGGNAETMSHDTVKLGHDIGELAEAIGVPLVQALDAGARGVRRFFQSHEKRGFGVYENITESIINASKAQEQLNKETKIQNDLEADARAQRGGDTMSLPVKAKVRIKTKDEEEAAKKANDLAIESANERDALSFRIQRSQASRDAKYAAMKRAFEESTTESEFEALVAAEAEKTRIKVEGEKQRAEAVKIAKAAQVQTEQAGAAGNPLALLAIQHREELTAVEGNEIAITELKRRHEMERRALTLATSQATAAGVAGNLAKVAGQYKSFSGVAKKAAQMQNAMDTYAGATAAYKSAAGIPYVGFLMAPIAAAAAIAGGMANASKINSTGFEKGGWTGNGGRSEVAGVVHGGEMVWSQEDVRRAGGRQAAENIRQGNSTTSISAPISINLHGPASKEDARRVAVAVGAELKALRIKERDATWMGYRA